MAHFAWIEYIEKCHQNIELDRGQLRQMPPELGPVLGELGCQEMEGIVFQARNIGILPRHLRHIRHIVFDSLEQFQLVYEAYVNIISVQCKDFKGTLNSRWKIATLSKKSILYLLCVHSLSFLHTN